MPHHHQPRQTHNCSAAPVGHHGGTKIHQAQTSLFLREPPHLSAEVPAGCRAGCPATSQTHSPIKRCFVDQKPDSYRRGRHWGGVPLASPKEGGFGTPPLRNGSQAQLLPATPRPPFPTRPPVPFTTCFLPDTPKCPGSCLTPRRPPIPVRPSDSCQTPKSCQTPPRPPNSCQTL